MKQTQPVFLFHFFLTPKQTDKPDDPLHIVRIGIAGRSLIDQFRFFDAGLRCHGQHDRCDLIDGGDVEDQFRIRRNLALAFQRHENDRRRRRESFVPPGERIAVRRFDD